MNAIPRQGRWQLPPGLDAAAYARRAVRDWLAGAGPDLATAEDDLAMLASELAANAAEHGRPPAFLTLSADQHTGVCLLSAVVQDSGPWLATDCPREPATDERHRGLVVVAALAAHWGVRESADGKDVWCELAVPSVTLGEVA